MQITRTQETEILLYARSYYANRRKSIASTANIWPVPLIRDFVSPFSPQRFSPRLITGACGDTDLYHLYSWYLFRPYRLLTLIHSFMQGWQKMKKKSEKWRNCFSKNFGHTIRPLLISFRCINVRNDRIIFKCFSTRLRAIWNYIHFVHWNAF